MPRFPYRVKESSPPSRRWLLDWTTTKRIDPGQRDDCLLGAMQRWPLRRSRVLVPVVLICAALSVSAAATARHEEASPDTCT